jgi:hypothetical protein
MVLSIRAPFVQVCRSFDIVTEKAAKATISLDSSLDIVAAKRLSLGATIYQALTVLSIPNLHCSLH